MDDSKPMHFFDPTGVHWVAEVPKQAQPFGINALCPECNPDPIPSAKARRVARIVDSIDHGEGTFRCSPPSTKRLLGELREHVIPAVTLSVESFRNGRPEIAVTDRRSDVTTRKFMEIAQ